jgi:3-vinyl bacteriochlorophyllide hydratase
LSFAQGWANDWIDAIAPSPWPASAGSTSLHTAHHASAHAPAPPKATARTAAAERLAPAPLYTPQERARRDSSVWTLVQAVLAPVQFLIFLISLALILNTLATGQGHEIATASVVLKTFALCAIMITGSIWEKVVFGKWLFARPFFWEDVFSMLVLALHTAYLLAVGLNIGDATSQLVLALAAYATYVINAGQFLWKLRMARLEARPQTPPPAQQTASVARAGAPTQAEAA